MDFEFMRKTYFYHFYRLFFNMYSLFALSKNKISPFNILFLCRLGISDNKKEKSASIIVYETLSNTISTF